MPEPILGSSQCQSTLGEQFDDTETPRREDRQLSIMLGVKRPHRLETALPQVAQWASRNKDGSIRSSARLRNPSTSPAFSLIVITWTLP